MVYTTAQLLVLAAKFEKAAQAQNSQNSQSVIQAHISQYLKMLKSFMKFVNGGSAGRPMMTIPAIDDKISELQSSSFNPASLSALWEQLKASFDSLRYFANKLPKLSGLSPTASQLQHEELVKLAQLLVLAAKFEKAAQAQNSQSVLQAHISQYLKMLKSFMQFVNEGGAGTSMMTIPAIDAKISELQSSSFNPASLSALWGQLGASFDSLRDLANKLPKLSGLSPTAAQLQREELVKLAKDAKKVDPKAEVRNRGKCIFPAQSHKVKDKKDHYPINNINEGRSALRYAGKQKSAPWYRGTVSELKAAIERAVYKEFPSLRPSKSSKASGEVLINKYAQEVHQYQPPPPDPNVKYLQETWQVASVNSGVSVVASPKVLIDGERYLLTPAESLAADKKKKVVDAFYAQIKSQKPELAGRVRVS